MNNSLGKAVPESRHHRLQESAVLTAKEAEGSSGSREKLLSEKSGLGKWGSMGTKEKFDAGSLIAEVIENSAEVISLPCCRQVTDTSRLRHPQTSRSLHAKRFRTAAA